MVELKFTLESHEGELQRISLRVQIVSFLMQQGVEEGNAVNDENTHKVHVAIRLDDKGKIEKIKNELVKYLNKLHDSDPISYGQFPTDITASELKPLNNPTPMTVIQLQKFAPSLMLEQTSKGTGAMLYMAEGKKDMARGMQGMAKAMKDMSSEFKMSMQEMSSEFKTSIQAMSEKMSMAIEGNTKILEKIDKKLTK